MPVIDTMVLFIAGDTTHKWHTIGKKALELVNRDETWWVPSYTLLEFDLVLKSRGYTYKERMEKQSLLMHDFPNITQTTVPITPIILHETSRLEEVYTLNYFDAGVVATALIIDGVVATADQKIQTVKEVNTWWERISEREKKIKK
jgi:predicted nucleic acid-binding protein